MLVTAEIGNLPPTPDRFYRPIASDPSIPLDPSVKRVPLVHEVMESMRDGVLPSPHNAGLMSAVRPEEGQEEFDLDDLMAADLSALRLGRKRALLMPTDRRGVAKGSGAVAIDGVVAITRLDTGMVTVTHITETIGGPWDTRHRPYLADRTPRRILQPLGLDAIQLEVTETHPQDGIAELRRRVPVFSFSTTKR